MTKNRYYKKYNNTVFGVILFLFTLLVFSRGFAQEKYHYINDKHQMNDQQNLQSNTQTFLKDSRNEHQIIRLYAEEFHFESHLNFPSPVIRNPEQYAESITPNNNGTFDITLINQGNTIKYLFQVSSIPKQQCESDDTTRACQQEAAPARGNIAEFQIALQGSKLVPGTYTFGESEATPREEVITYSRQLYSDPSHGKLGCQTWGMGALKVKRADYNPNGKLEYLEASLFRACNQTSPFPPTLPEDNLPQVEVESIEKYTYHASWHCHLKVTGKSPR